MAEIQKKEELQDKVDNWFTTIIDNIKIDHLMVSSNIAPVEKQNFYDALIHGNGEAAVGQMRETSTQFYISNIVNDYINELKVQKKIPLKLAMGLSHSKLLVWSEIKDNDEETENALLIAEAKVNAKYSQKGFFINSTIIEQSDNLSIPPHYQSIISK